MSNKALCVVLQECDKIMPKGFVEGDSQSFRMSLCKHLAKHGLKLVELLCFLNEYELVRKTECDDVWMLTLDVATGTIQLSTIHDGYEHKFMNDDYKNYVDLMLKHGLVRDKPQA